MELQTALVCCGIAVATAAVLLLVSLFGSSRTSYEEARAEQRRAATELLALAGGAASKPKKSKKQGKKTKEKKHKEVTRTGSERDSDGPADSGPEEESAPGPVAQPSASRSHVEFGENTVLDVQMDKPVKIQIRKRGKDPKIKPILLNKEDVSCVSEPGTPTPPSAPELCNHFEEIHPKDEFELLHASSQKAEKREEVVEKKESKVKGGKGKHGKQAAAPPSPAAPAPAPASEPPQKERHNSGDSAKEQRKTKKSEKRHAVDDSGDREEGAPPPLNPVQPADLTTDKILRPAPTHAPLSAAPAPAPAPASAPAPAAKGKKGKKSEPSVMTLVGGGGDGGGVNVSELVRLVSEAALSRNEIQVLTDALLNKQHGPLPQHSEWSEGPNDPVQKLKKQLAEKEKALADEQEASQAVHAKLKELRASLNVERSRATAAVRAAEEATAANKVELHTLTVRMQRLIDDNHALAQDKLLLQSKLGAEGEAQAQRVQLELRIQRQNETETALLQQLGALQAEAGARALEAQQVRCDAAAARDAAHLAQQHAAELAQQLQEASRACAELEGAHARAAHAEAAAGGVRAELDAELQRLRGAERALLEAERARDELQAELQRLRAAQHALLDGERAREEADRLNRQLSSEIKSLREQLVAKDEEMKKEHQKHQQNGLLPSEDTQKKVELVKLEGALEGLRAELAAARDAHDHERRQLHALQQQLQDYKDKNNELRTKNWKVMEALQSTEKALQSKVPAAPSPDATKEAVSRALEQQQRETAEVLRAACPQAAPDAAPGAPWLDAFAARLRLVLRAASPATPAPAADELRAQNAHLQELVDKYKKIIEDTPLKWPVYTGVMTEGGDAVSQRAMHEIKQTLEGVLSQLQQNVTAEEQRWERQLLDKQRELDRLQQTTVTQEPLAFAFSCIEKSLPAIVSEMQSKIDALQSELDRSRRDRTLDLAGAERNLEDHTRLMISEKHQIESLNGPSQVGLEEK